VEQQFSGEGHDIVILGKRRNLWLLLSGCKYLRKNSCTASCPLLSWGCANSSLQFIGHNCACSLLWLGLCQLKPAVYLVQLCICTPLPTHKGTGKQTRWPPQQALLNNLACTILLYCHVNVRAGFRSWLLISICMQIILRCTKNVWPRENYCLPSYLGVIAIFQ
jgi:hypothetical protein